MGRRCGLDVYFSDVIVIDGKFISGCGKLRIELQGRKRVSIVRRGPTVRLWISDTILSGTYPCTPSSSIETCINHNHRAIPTADWFSCCR